MSAQAEKASFSPIKILKSKPGSKELRDNQKKLSQELTSKLILLDQNHKSEKETEAESDNITTLFFSKKNKSSSPCKKSLKFKDLIVETENEEDDVNMELPLLIKTRKRKFTATNTQITQGEILTLKKIAKKEKPSKNVNIIDKNKIIVEERANSNISELTSKFFCCL